MIYGSKLSSFSGETAWEHLLRAPRGHWDIVRQQLKNGASLCEIAPKFIIEPGAKFFCIGSCFARNIEEALIYQNVECLSKRIICPASEWPERPNGILNKFTVHSILNELRWAAGIEPCPDDVICESDRGYFDLQLNPGHSPVSLERARERRTYFTRDYFSRLAHADVVVITLGLVEAWFDHKLSRYLNATPSFWTVRREPTRFEAHILDFESNRKALFEIVDIAFAFGVKKIVLTVSPVPLLSTFSGRDIVVANTYSKSTLRSVADVCASKFENVAYYPSYENILMLDKSIAYQEDCVHVKNEVVKQNMADFLKHYLPHLPLTQTDFEEMPYLRRHPDVQEAVRSGELASGFEHWRTIGMSEGRALS